MDAKRFVDLEYVKPRSGGPQEVAFDDEEDLPDITAMPSGEGVILMATNGILRPVNETQARSIMVPYRGDDKKVKARK